MGCIGLGLRLGLFQLSLGILGVLILGLLNRLLIQDIQVPAVLAAVAVGGQQLMGFTRAWFGHRSDRIPISRLRRTPFIVSSTVAIALLFGAACQLVLRLATISGGGLLTLLKAWNGGDLFVAYGGVFGLQMVCFLAAALMTRRLDVVGFRNTMKTRFADVMEIAVD